MSDCRCSHTWRQHIGTGRRCKVADCDCNFGPPKPAPVPMPRRIRSQHTVNPRGEIESFAREDEPATAVQTMTIPVWHPTMSANGSHGHWRTHQARHDADQRTGLTYAQHHAWRFVDGKVSLTITLIYPRTYRVDADNLAARCKGLIDGLRLRKGRGYFTDDSTEWLDLHVGAEVRKGIKATEITLRRAPEASTAATHQLALTGGTTDA